jgi:hypothetical protein
MDCLTNLALSLQVTTGKQIQYRRSHRRKSEQLPALLPLPQPTFPLIVVRRTAAQRYPRRWLLWSQLWLWILLLLTRN